MARGMKRWACAFALFALPGLNVWAATGLDDPTRPAFELVPGLDGGAVSAQPAPVPKGLQSVILSGKRVAAIINGAEVELGQKYGGATLSVVNETCVVLVGPEGRQVMHLYPDVKLSKTESACEGRNGLPPIRKVATRKQPKKNPARKATKATCADEVTKDGSEK